MLKQKSETRNIHVNSILLKKYTQKIVTVFYSKVGSVELGCHVWGTHLYSFLILSEF